MLFIFITLTKQKQMQEDTGLSVGATELVSIDSKLWRMLLRPSAGQMWQWVSEWDQDAYFKGAELVSPIYENAERV